VAAARELLLQVVGVGEPLLAVAVVQPLAAATGEPLLEAAARESLLAAAVDPWSRGRTGHEGAFPGTE
jgi:hypothetical protein